MDTTCGFDESVLLDYVLGQASLADREAIERSAACKTEIERLVRQFVALYRVACPDVPTLVAFQERRIGDSALALVVHRHIATCLHCAEELALLAEIDAVPLAPAPSPLRRVVAAFQSPLRRAEAVRGDMLLYTTPGFAVHLRIRHVIGHADMWTVRGQVRTADGRLAADLLQRVEARRAGETSIAARVEASGAFRFERLPSGMWTLALQTLQEEIVIEQVAVGDEAPSTL